MSKEIYISSTPHETRLAIVENDALTEIYYERENEYTLAGSIYNGKVTRVLPGMQSSFVDIGLDRDAFLYITDFMEEAGETADFEASAGGDQKRAPRENGRSGRSDRGDRGDRSDRPALPRPEPTDEDLFTQAVSGLDPARPVADSERGERSRRGGRNRRDRNPERRERAPEPRLEPKPEPIVASPPPVEASELGEGAPGADGSRRWRGRRGRRGNRGTGAGQPQANEQNHSENIDQIEPVTPVAPVRAATGPVYDAYETYPEVPELEAAIPVAEFERLPREGRNDRGGRGRRDRGGPPQRTPRGPEPSHDLYQVQAYGAVEEVPEIEPLILPGESLSKYRTPDPSQASSAPVAAAPVATVSEFVAQGWDGGSVLPGETIRPRTSSAAPAYDSPRREERGPRRDGRDDRSGGGRDRGRNDRGGRDRDERRPRQEIAAPAVVYTEPEAEVIAERLEPSHVEEPEQQHAAPVEAIVDSTFVAPSPMPAPVVVDPIPEPEEFHEQFQETVHEFEPEEASASYRVDPVPPSEFRQSAPVLEEEFVEEPQASAEPALEEPAPAFEHEVTSIFPTGEMHSEPETLLTQDLVAPSEVAQGAEHSAVPVAADVVAADQTAPQAAPWFEPGSGVLEEEMLDDEEDESVLPALGARHDDPQEQEALEHAADLGTMLREMSIDNLTRSEALVEEEDDDFDEDFLEEDQDFAVEVSDTEEFDEEEPAEEADEPEYRMEEGEGDAEAEFAAPAQESAPAAEAREPRRNEPGRREGRRDGRRGDRNRRPGSGDRDRGNSASDKPSSEGRGGERHRHEGGRGRQTMQATNLPAISDLLKPGQELLCQIAKEPIAKKGARITSHIALPGRFLVFMPTVSHTGVSRKIESDGERRRLKEILLSEKGDAAGGFIVRTAASGASEEELRSDLRFLLNLWTDIKTRSESSKSPALIYHDLNLVERVLRDQVTDNFSAIWVDTESQYEQVLRFLQRFQPSLIRRVKLYTKETPLFEQFGITEEINKALRSKVWLKSGGSIVINQTEALVAIDINTGKFVGKTARLEDTIVKTNLDAIPEIVRQIRLRDLGGIIIIDFIDMDERKNRNKVMAALEEELKSDRAPSKVLPFNDFGLVAITRKRVKQSLERTLSSTCNVCQGTGMTKSPVTVCNDIYIEMRKMQKHLDRGDVMLRVHPEVVKQLKSTTSRWLQEMEEMVGKTILVKSDPSLHPEQFDLH